MLYVVRFVVPAGMVANFARAIAALAKGTYYGDYNHRHLGGGAGYDVLDEHGWRPRLDDTELGAVHGISYATCAGNVAAIWEEPSCLDDAGDDVVACFAMNGARCGLAGSEPIRLLWDFYWAVSRISDAGYVLDAYQSHRPDMSPIAAFLRDKPVKLNWQGEPDTWEPAGRAAGSLPDMQENPKWLDVALHSSADYENQE